MKTVGIICAMAEEMANIKEKTDIISAKNIIGLDFFMGKYASNNVVMVTSGIGKVNAAICTQVLIDLYGVDYVINVGVAGAVDRDLDIGDIVISKDAVQHDMDVTALGDEIGVIPRMDTSVFMADDYLLSIAQNVVNRTEGKNIVFGRIASGDQFIADNDRKSFIRNNFKAHCAEMEGAAVSHTCYLNKVPFLIIRGISDKADDSADVNYDEFFKKVAIDTTDIVLNIINEIE